MTAQVLSCPVMRNIEYDICLLKRECLCGHPIILRFMGIAVVVCLIRYIGALLRELAGRSGGSLSKLLRRVALIAV
jgi:hypothetical protein